MKMKALQLEIALAMLLLSASPVYSFSSGGHKHAALAPQTLRVQRTRRHAASFDSTSKDQAERLREMASNLRSEAETLEAEQRETWAQAVTKTFTRFDTNKDGKISLQELQNGLEKAFKVEISEHRVKQIMQAFDTNKDGFLQPQEFVGLDQMRNKMDSLARQEIVAERAEKKALQEQLAAQARLDEMLELINDKPPSATDKAMSTLPYVLPMLDGLHFANHLMTQHPDNPLASAAAEIFGVYTSVPLAGIVGLCILSFLKGNLAFNRLIRFNMRQAVYLDIALFVPRALTSAATLAAGGLQADMLEQSNDVSFVALMATLMYAVGSSLFGATPDKLPLISQRVEDRMVTPEKVKERFLSSRKQDEHQK